MKPVVMGGPASMRKAQRAYVSMFLSKRGLFGDGISTEITLHSQIRGCPRRILEELMQASFPGYDGKTWLCSTWEIAKSAGYSGPYAFWRAVEAKNTCAGSEYHFYQDGALRITTISSYEAGPAHLRAWTREREQQNAERCRFVLASSGSPSAIL